MFISGDGAWQAEAPVAFGERIPSAVVPTVGAAGLASRGETNHQGS